MKSNHSAFPRPLFAILSVLFLTFLSPLQAQTLTTLVTFNGANGGSPGFGKLLLGQDGNLHGTTQAGGQGGGGGTIFSITTSGSLTTVYTFCSKPNCSDGGVPEGALIQSSDGTFYGTTTIGGDATTPGYGTIFKFSAASPPSTVYTFCSQSPCTDGGRPASGLIQGSDGNLYGTATSGVVDAGTVFKISPAGALTTLYAFCSQGDPCVDGSNPIPGLIQAADGNFYGMTSDGGANATTTFPATGTIFKITPQGSLTTLYNFCVQPPFCHDGAAPMAALIQASDGNFYGTTYLD
jgi:uncharacterized repeat protein (TIGR03803 family)